MTVFVDKCPQCGREFKNSYEFFRRYCSVACEARAGYETRLSARRDAVIDAEESERGGGVNYGTQQRCARERQ